MTNQEAFNLVYRHFIIKGKPKGSPPDSDYCFYYSSDTGTCCAIGLLLLHQGMRPAEVERIIGQIQDLIRFPHIQFLLSGIDVNLLYAIQKAHDTSYTIRRKNMKFIEVFKEKLYELSIKFNLTIPEEN